MTLDQLLNYSYADAERFLHTGHTSQDTWEAYCKIWRNSVPRFSSLAEAYQD